jgi:hypothetical protein
VSLQIHEAEQIPNRVNPKKSMLRHMTIKWMKTEDKKISKGSKSKWYL